MVLYRKYRPQTFAALVGHDHIAEAFRRALANNAVAHAYLFCGPRGCGKTSTARILAKAINCEKVRSLSTTHNLQPTTLSFEPCNECDTCKAITQGNHLDVIEIDAASNRGIDDIRELRERIKLSPAMAAKKVYIIDEVHMLTTEAFNALLKTLEEPPQHAVLLLATTEPHKVPQTIISRCERFDFPPASIDSLTQAITAVCTAEQITIEPAAIGLLAQLADGSFRDAIKLLDQLAGLHEPITQALVERYYKVPNLTVVATLYETIISGDAKAVIVQTATLRELGFEVTHVTVALISFVRKIVLARLGTGQPVTLADNDHAVALKDLLQLMRGLSIAEREIRSSPIPELPLELALLDWIGLVHTTIPDVPHAQASKRQAVPVVAVVEPEMPQIPQQVAAPKVQEIDQAIAPEEIGAMLADTSDSIEIAPLESADVVAAATSTPELTQEITDEIAVSPEKKVTITMLQEAWPTFITDLLLKNHSAGLLLKNAAINDFDGTTLTVEVGYKFHKERIEQDKTRAILENHISQSLGKQILITCILKEKKKTRDHVDELADIAQQVFGTVEA